MGGAQPLAATMAGASMPRRRMPAERIEIPPAHPLSRRQAKDLDEALAIIEKLARPGKPISVGLLGNAADIFPSWCARRAPRHGHRPDLGARSGQRLPAQGLDARRMGGEARAERSEGGRSRRQASMAVHVRPCSTSKRGRADLDYGNNIRQMALEEGVADAFDFPGFVPAYIRPLFCRGIGPFRWAALSGDPEDIYKTDAKVKELMPDEQAPAQLARHGARAHRLPGPAGAHLLGRPRRPPPPRPRLQRDGGEGRAEGADRHRPRPSRFRLGRLAPTARPKRCGRLGRRLRLAAAQRAAQHRLGRDLGVAASRRRRRHGLLAAFAGMVIVCDGTRSARALERVLWNDPATGVMRHADAGYDIAIDCAPSSTSWIAGPRR
jgi:urocanate hydratase